MFNSVYPQNITQSGYAPHFPMNDGEDWIDSLPRDSLDVYVDYAFAHYNDVIIHSPEVWRWFGDRKMHLSHELIERFKLGFADRTLCKDHRREKGRSAEITRGALQMLGLLKDTGHQYFHGCAVFPIFDIDGRIVGAYGRRITPECRPGHIYHLHWYHGSPTFFNIQALRDYNSVTLYKSPVEAMVAIAAGFQNSIATTGLYSFGQHHLETLDKFKPKEVVLALDATDSGNLVSGMIAQALDAQGINTRRMALPRNMDVVDFVQSRDNHEVELKQLVNSSEPYQQTYENILRG